jgi:hypothetical protein
MRTSVFGTDMARPLGPPWRDTASRKALPVRKYPPSPNRFRGIPPPPTFDVNALSNGTLLTETETAGIVRRSKACLSNWRKYSDHPLRWRKVAGRVLYELSSIREFLKGTK